MNYWRKMVPLNWKRMEGYFLQLFRKFAWYGMNCIKFNKLTLANMLKLNHQIHLKWHHFNHWFNVTFRKGFLDSRDLGWRSKISLVLLLFSSVVFFSQAFSNFCKRISSIRYQFVMEVYSPYHEVNIIYPWFILVLWRNSLLT